MTLEQRVLAYLQSDDCMEWKKAELRQELKMIGKCAFYDRMSRDLGFKVWVGELNFMKIRHEILQNRQHAQKQMRRKKNSQGWLRVNYQQQRRMSNFD